MQCTNPGNITIRNGSVMTSDPQYRYGTELVFECNEGFQLRGKDVITCKEFGWDSRRLPYCKGNWSFSGENDGYSDRESGFKSDVAMCHRLLNNSLCWCHLQKSLPSWKQRRWYHTEIQSQGKTVVGGDGELLAVRYGYKVLCGQGLITAYTQSVFNKLNLNKITGKVKIV